MLSEFAGGEGTKRKRVYRSVHQRRERVVHQTMALQPRLAGEHGGYDGELEVPAARACAGMTRMTRGIVHDFDRFRFEHGEATFDFLDGAHGSGFATRGEFCGDVGAVSAAGDEGGDHPFDPLSSTYLASMTAWMSTKASINPVPPKSLKSTQMSVG